MKQQIIYFFLFFFEGMSIVSGQHIHYFTSDNNSHVVLDVYAKIGTQIHTIVDSSELECWSIVAQKDFNANGRLDLLLSHVHGCGGNCCGNTFAFVFYDKGRFFRTKEVGNGDYLETQEWKGKPTILLHTNLKDSITGHKKWIKERYALEGNRMVKIGEYRAAKVNTSDGSYNLNWDKSRYQTNTYFLYTVHKNGQSLWALANKYKTTVATLKKMNQLSSDYIFIGDVLKRDIQK